MFPISFVCILKLKYHQYRPLVHEQKRIFYFYFFKNSSKVLVLNLAHTLKSRRFSSNLTTQKYHNMDHLYMLYKYETMFFFRITSSQNDYLYTKIFLSLSTPFALDSVIPWHASSYHASSVSGATKLLFMLYQNQDKWHFLVTNLDIKLPVTYMITIVPLLSFL